MPLASNSPSVGAIDGLIYAVARWETNQRNDLAAYNPATDTWSTKASMPTKRQSAAGGVIAGKLYVAGGVKLPASGFIFDVLANLEAYDPVSNSWTTLAAMPTARSMAGAGVVNGILYVIGGSDAVRVLNTNEAFTP